MKPTASDLAPVNMLEEHVMLAVLRTGADAYGMNVRRELEDVTGRDVTIGSVYITLDRLEAKGLVGSTRTAAAQGSSPASRRVFAVTPLGVRVLAETRAMRERLWAGIDLRARLRSI
ncbi:MAG TPA: helix-turn-helix transcriptional regulator [Vicinamibacterales bacterium]|nr:helix-turn-helix transcriptional regulator [Vicinamibacterales bacterium]